MNNEDELQATISTRIIEKVVSENVVISDDAAEWAINDFTRDYYSTHKCKQNKNLDFPGTKRDYSDGTSRRLSESLFGGKLINGKKVPRPWLIYSVKGLYSVQLVFFLR
ncbi:unnamed protein product [Arctia plantaginis]|uniref:Uncharacterized protein n=1 Tax=Arctia plantaginis TaxID=874455 RepID=A0A8S1A076_ARCPL|nr:unnamed protein product [Arctia plantaginis]CAB3238474.1 unnamed protein product [Arctia plantaginis]